MRVVDLQENSPRFSFLFFFVSLFTCLLTGFYYKGVKCDDDVERRER